jgi:hypothetical protein
MVDVVGILGIGDVPSTDLRRMKPVSFAAPSYAMIELIYTLGNVTDDPATVMVFPGKTVP